MRETHNKMQQVSVMKASPSAKMGTVEFTGLEMIKKMAEGQCFAQASASPETMPALVLKRSSRVIPGFLGTPTEIKIGNDSLLDRKVTVQYTETKEKQI